MMTIPKKGADTLFFRMDMGIATVGIRRFLQDEIIVYKAINT